MSHGRLVPVNGNEVFDRAPIKLHGFTFTARTAAPVGRPSIVQWQEAMQFASAAVESSPYWVADLMAYSESRQDWREKIDQAKTVTKLAEKTLSNLGYVGRHVGTRAREVSPSVAHSSEVASLEEREQIKWLNRAKDEGLTVRELRNELRASRRPRIIEGQAILEGRYRVILADPPWSYRDSGATKDGSLGKAERHYLGMSMEELAKLPIEAHALPNAVLFMWVTATMLYENPGPRDIIEAWGFKPKTGIVWDKVLGNPGHYGFHVRHEHVIIATRGSCLPDVADPQDDSVQTIRRSGEHSQKPDELRTIIEKHYTSGPYLELFGRAKVKGWTVFGNDARLWSEDATR